MRKKTKKETLQELKTILKHAEDYIPVPNVPAHIVTKDRIENGEEIYLCRCSCGTEFRVKYENVRRCGYIIKDGAITCPACGCGNHTCTNHGDIYDCTHAYKWGPVCAIVVLPGSTKANWTAIGYNPYWEHDIFGAEDWRTSKASVTINPKYVLRYTAEDGFSGVYFGGEILTRSEEFYRFAAAQDLAEYVKGITGGDWKDWVSSAIKQAEDKRNSRAEQTMQMSAEKKAPYIAYQPLDASAFRLDKIKTILGEKLQDDGNGKVVMACKCMACRTDFQQEVHDYYYQAELTCPSCGNSSQVRKSSYSSIVTAETTTLPGRDLLIRYWGTYASIEKMDATGILTVETYVTEDRRYFAKIEKGKLIENTLSISHGGTIRKENRIERSLRWRSNETVQKPDEILAAIEASSLRYTGLAEVWGLKDGYVGCEAPGELQYLGLYTRHPKAELLAKANLPGIAQRILKYRQSDQDAILKPGKDARSVSELLGASMRALRAAEQLDATTATARRIDAMTALDIYLQPDQYIAATREGIDMYRLERIMTTYHLGARRWLEYLQSAYDYQCISKSEALHIWEDYLNMASECGFDLSAKKRLYPASLKKEHDVAMFAYNRLKQEAAEKAFALSAKANQWLEWTPKDKKFVVSVPKTQQAVVEEATAQDNCLRSYLGKIADGKTRIAFLRRNTDKDTPFVTMEVTTEGRIAQVKGKYNSNPSQDVWSFVRDWAKVKGLSLGY